MKYFGIKTPAREHQSLLSMTDQARFAIYAAAHRRQWGRWATVRFCQRRGVPRRLLTLAIQLDTINRCV